MAQPEFLGDGHTPRRSDGLWAIEQKILGALLDGAGGGGSGSSCLLCGAADPVAAPSCTCALYYNVTTGSFWYWDNTGAAWVMLIGP